MQSSGKTIKMGSVIVICIVLLIANLLALPFAYAYDNTSDGGSSTDLTLEEMSGKAIGVQTGSIFDSYVTDAVPDAEVAYFSSFTDEINALKAKKIDGICSSETTLDALMKEEDDIAVIDEELGSIGCCFLFPKNDKGESNAKG